MRAVHGGQKAFACPYPGCLKGLHAWACARPDKLTSHIKTCHGRHAAIPLGCPAVDCHTPPRNLVGLAGHIRIDHLVDNNPRKQRERCGNEVEILRAIANAAPAADDE